VAPHRHRSSHPHLTAPCPPLPAAAIVTPINRRERRRARQHDYAMRRQSQRRAAMAVWMRVLSGISAWGMTTGTARASRRLARPFSPAGAYSCRTGRKPIFKRGEISAIGPRRNIGASIAASVCRTIGGPVADCDAGCHYFRPWLSPASWRYLAAMSDARARFAEDWWKRRASL
jgi:hypothetical protein